MSDLRVAGADTPRIGPMRLGFTLAGRLDVAPPRRKETAGSPFFLPEDQREVEDRRKYPFAPSLHPVEYLLL